MPDTLDAVLDRHEVLSHHDLIPLLGVGVHEGMTSLYVAVSLDQDDADDAASWLIASTGDPVALARALSGSDPLRVLFEQAERLTLVDAEGVASPLELDDAVVRDWLPTPDAQLELTSPTVRATVARLVA